MADVTVNTGTSIRTMIGWEATAQIGHENDAITELYEYPSSTLANYVSDLLDGVMDVGLNRVRLEIRFDDWNATGYHWSGGTTPDAIQPSTSTSGQRHYDRLSSFMDSFGTDWRDRLIAQGETLYINICFVDFRNNGYHLEDTPSEFAYFTNEVTDWFFNRYGFLPDSFEVLEPDNSSGNQNWTAAKLANGIVAANTLLVSNGYTGIKWMAPSSTTLGNVNSWITSMKSAQPSITSLIEEYSYHLYGGDDSDLATLRTTAIADGKGTAMLESHLGFGGINADYKRLYKDLTVGYGTSWQQYVICYPYPSATDDGGNYFLVNTTTWAVTLGSRTKQLKQYFKYIRRGAVLKGVTNSNGSYLGLPFENTNGAYVVPIWADGTNAVNVKSLPAGTYGITYALDNGTTGSFTNQTITTGDVTFTLPSAGVATVYDIDYLSTPPSSVTVNYYGSSPSPND